jgi:hypothetical protein
MSDHLDDLQALARYARERHQLYKARSYGPRLSSPARLRELQRADEQAAARLRAAQAEERRAAGTEAGRQDRAGRGREQR